MLLTSFKKKKLLVVSKYQLKPFFTKYLLWIMNLEFNRFGVWSYRVQNVSLIKIVVNEVLQLIMTT